MFRVRLLFVSLWLPKPPDNKSDWKSSPLRQVKDASNNKIHLVHLDYLIFLRNFQHIRIVSTDFHKVSCIKFHGNPSGGSRDRRTVTKKLIRVFHKYENEPTNKTGNLRVT